MKVIIYNEKSEKTEYNRIHYVIPNVEIAYVRIENNKLILSTLEAFDDEIDIDRDLKLFKRR